MSTMKTKSIPDSGSAAPARAWVAVKELHVSYGIMDI